MILQRFGIFGKVFLYTLVFLLLAISLTAAVFAQQFKDFYDYLQLRQYTTAFEPLKMKMVKVGDIEEIIAVANEFHSQNQSFAFNLETRDGNIIYRTKGTVSAAGKTEAGSTMTDATKFRTIELTKAEPILQAKNKTIDQTKDGILISLENDMVVRTITADSADLFKEFSSKAFMIALLLLCASIVGALLFARGITKPIKKLADDTSRMARLEPVSIPIVRRDELGQLAADVHRMYEKLKQTISKLEAEIQREKEMEENQRYFFSAASHELKTPIAAASALLEGMIADIGEYKNHPKYLRECLNLMSAQNSTITEILKLVKLSDERIVPYKENVNLLTVINSLLPEYRTLAEKKNQRILVDVPAEVVCHTDKKMIRTVLSNIIMNAIQNSAEGEEIRIWSEKSVGGLIRVSILNTNAAIDEEIKVKLFEPFYRVDKARSRKEERSGLGLTIVKKILDSLEIPFNLEVADKDVVFWLEVPV